MRERGMEREIRSGKGGGDNSVRGEERWKERRKRKERTRRRRRRRK